MFKLIDKYLAKFVILLIQVYQKTLSPDHSLFGKLFPYHGCKFHPTCSMYGIAVLKKHGLFRGLPLTIKRFGKCHPWSDGGIDLPQ